MKSGVFLVDGKNPQDGWGALIVMDDPVGDNCTVYEAQIGDGEVKTTVTAAESFDTADNDLAEAAYSATTHGYISFGHFAKLQQFPATVA